METKRKYIGAKMKYVVDINGDFVIISNCRSHDSVNIGHIQSAGFLRFYLYDTELRSNNIGAECFGESISLGKVSNHIEDSEIITRSLKEY